MNFNNLTEMPNLMEYLDEHYSSSDLMTCLQRANSLELARINYIIDDMAKQFAISTATWGLILWEFEYGIVTDHKKTYEQRREILKSKRRGHGTTTKAMLKNVAEAYSNGEADIIEVFERYKLIIKFIGVKGIPEQLSELDKTIKSIKPCHLSHEFEFSYMIWDEFDSMSITCDELEVYNR